MSDNAGSNDLRDQDVHASTEGTPPPEQVEEPQQPPSLAIEDVDATGDTAQEDVNSLEAALSALPTGEEDLEAPEIDPDTLANLAALSRIHHEDEEGVDEVHDGGDELEVHGAHDFANLIGQGALTGEQVQQIVDSLGDVHPHSDDQEDTSPQPDSTRHTDDESEREGGTDDGSRRGDDDYRGPKSYFEDGKQKRRRNRTVL